MEKAVVDSSVAIKWFIPQPNSTEAHCILDAYQNGSLSLLAPDLIYAEIGNIIWKLQRFQSLSQEEGKAILTVFRDEVELSIMPSFQLLDQAYSLAVKYQRTVYDSLYIALSLRQNCQFVTADQKLVNAVSNQLSNVVAIADWSGNSL